MDELNPFIANGLIGVVNVHFSLLSFYEGREVDPIIVENLVEIFRKSCYGCNWDVEQNYILAVISELQLEEMLRTNSLTRKDLRKTIFLRCNRLTISISTFKLHYIQGKHRIKATKKFLSLIDTWWTIKLYCLNRIGKLSREQ
jgi:hypothetical protein